MNNTNSNQAPNELIEALAAVKKHFIYAGAFSAAINILVLVPIIYMLQLYDRVLSSGSMSTLMVLTLLMVSLLVAMGGFEWVRSYILVAASNNIETRLRDRVFNATHALALQSSGAKMSAQPINDLTGLRQFLTGNGIFAFFDAPWFPVYLAVMFMFHTWFGVVALVAVIVMISLAWTTEVVTNKKLRDANVESNAANVRLISSLRNAEVIEAMGMAGVVRRNLQKINDRALVLQTDASKLAGGLTAISKTFRVTIQSLILGLGALLTLQHEISGGMMIAGSLLLGRALAPIDMLVATWRGFSTARSQYERLNSLLLEMPAPKEHMKLPPPQGKLSVEQLSVTPPGAKAPVLKDVTFQLDAGEVLGVVGPSASGKSTLARAILGVWPAASGKVRLDGADISAWDRNEIGPYLGYLPQDIELFDGTISENICRFRELDADKIVAAAKLAGIHEMILRQPDGYDTVIGGAGGVLSGGQRQRIGLARAIYGNPRLLVLDEPNSNLDDQGERELVAAIQRVKDTGCTIIIISHRTLVLMNVDKLLVLKEGLLASFGPREQVLNLLTRPETRRPATGTDGAA